MKARDVMTAPAITVKPDTLVAEIARTFVENRISAVPVVNDAGKLVGIVSEGDLMRRADIQSERPSSWWLLALASNRSLAAAYVKSHARKAADVMTTDVVTAGPGTSLRDIAALLERKRIKRVPIVENGRPVGIVSRANLIQAIAASVRDLDIPVTDRLIRTRLIDHLKQQPWANLALVNIGVSGGVVELSGIIASEEQRQAMRIAAESIQGVTAVNDHLSVHALYEFAED